MQWEPWLELTPLANVLTINWPDRGLCQPVDDLRVNLSDLQEIILGLLHFLPLYRRYRLDIVKEG
jgi:hypothetical protein